MLKFSYFVFMFAAIASLPSFAAVTPELDSSTLTCVATGASVCYVAFRTWKQKSK